jgi:hypothetical protein
LVIGISGFQDLGTSRLLKQEPPMAGTLQAHEPVKPDSAATRGSDALRRRRGRPPKDAGDRPADHVDADWKGIHVKLPPDIRMRLKFAILARSARGESDVTQNLLVLEALNAQLPALPPEVAPFLGLGEEE